MSEAPKTRDRKPASEVKFMTETAFTKKYEKLIKQELKHVENQLRELFKHRSFLMKELGIPEEE
jgi:hypothetical protein